MAIIDFVFIAETRRVWSYKEMTYFILYDFFQNTVNSDDIWQSSKDWEGEYSAVSVKKQADNRTISNAS